MAVDVLIESQKTRTGLMVPKEAIATEGGRSLVYVKTAPELFTARPVTARGPWDNEFIVEEGLEDGDIVAISGLYQIRMSAGKAQSTDAK